MLPITCQFTSGGGGHSLKNGGTGMCGPQDLLFTPLLQFTRPPVEIQVHSQDPSLKETCVNSPPKKFLFLENMTIFISRSSNLTVIFFISLKFFFKILVFKATCFFVEICTQAFVFKAIYLLTSPQVRKSEPHKKKLSASPWVQNSIYFSHACIIYWSHLVNNWDYYVKKNSRVHSTYTTTGWVWESTTFWVMFYEKLVLYFEEVSNGKLL